MEFALAKCAKVVLERGKLVLTKLNV
jgi:hypothetical protein